MPQGAVVAAAAVATAAVVAADTAEAVVDSPAVVAVAVAPIFPHRRFAAVVAVLRSPDRVSAALEPSVALDRSAVRARSPVR